MRESEEKSFRRLLSWLAEGHTFISYSEGVQRVLAGHIDRPYIAFSFDDGFASNMRTAAILEEFGTVGCFFVTTGFIGMRTAAEGRQFLGYDPGVDEPAMSWSDLTRLKRRGHEVGNHTYSHRQISSLSPDEARDQVEIGAQMLRERLGGVDHFAWPFGRFGHFTKAAVDAVFEAGHVSCASAERGAHVASGGVPVSNLCVRREHLMTSWPLRHSRYFLARSAARALPADQGWPVHWRVPA